MNDEARTVIRNLFQSADANREEMGRIAAVDNTGDPQMVMQTLALMAIAQTLQAIAIIAAENGPG